MIKTISKLKGITTVQGGSKVLHSKQLVFFAAVILVAVIILQFSFLTMTKSVTFDGAMNLQVASSLADGNGYSRTYWGVKYFPQEIQTNGPYIVVAALVFKIFGVGVEQSQATNLVYLLAISFLLLWIFSREGVSFGVLSVLALFLSPGIYQYGVGGYGEIPALFWWLLGSWVFLGSKEYSLSYMRAVLGGLCLGLAVMTKTVLLIGVLGMFITYAMLMLWERMLPFHHVIARISILITSFLSVMLLFEFWRYTSLGGWDEYVRWWVHQMKAVGAQSGAVTGYGDINNHTEKLTIHIRKLSNYLGFSLPATLIWLVLPYLLLGYAFLRNELGRIRWFVVAILVVSIGYFLWWLLVTPTAKSWHRRIFNGIVLQHVLWMNVLVWITIKLKAHHRVRSTLLACCLLGAFMIFQKQANELIIEPRSAFSVHFQSAIDELNKLPEMAVVFGDGWYSAPRLSLYSDKNFSDINHFSMFDLQNIGRGYLALGPEAISTRRFERILSRYPNHALVADNVSVQIYEVDFTNPINPFLMNEVDSSKIRQKVDFLSENYEYVYGMHSPEGEGWRWAMTDVVLIMKNNLKNVLDVEIYRPKITYKNGDSLDIWAEIGNCKAGNKTIKGYGRAVVSFLVEQECIKKQGEVIEVRLYTNNFHDPEDPARINRQLSYVIRSIELK